jgi:type IV pilus assembly protein PilN
VILINLLPHREERRQQRKRAFFAGLFAAFLVGVVVAGFWYTALSQLTAAQQARNQFLRAETTKLNAQIRDIANLRTEIDALNARKKAVEDLQTDRNVPVHLLNELVKQTPEGVYLQTIKQTGSQVSVSGQAQTNERVSELLRNTSYNSAWLEKPELIEIKSGNLAGPNKEQRRVFDFLMRVSLKRPQAATPGAAASAPAPGTEPDTEPVAPPPSTEPKANKPAAAAAVSAVVS